MKNLLAKFYKSLACRVALAIVATATVAKAHDLPQHFPLAPTDWGMIQQDCLGYQTPGYLAVDSGAPLKQQAVEITIAEPDFGNPPEPQAVVNRLVSTELIGPELYDGVDCAQLESYYRNCESNQLAEQLVEYKPKATPSVDNQQTVAVSKFEFHKSFFAACSCDFENRHANQSILPPKLALKRTFVDDHFVNEFNCLKPLLLRNSGRSFLAGSPFEPLAIAIPSTSINNKEWLAKAFSQLAGYDCIARSEFHSSRTAFDLGEFTSSLTNSWFANALPSASYLLAEYANNLKPSKLTTPAPMFVIVQNAAGNEVAIPISQAKEWEQTEQPKSNSPAAPISQEFKDLVETANARLQWAGGRLSSAASFMNDWFSDRMARAKSNDLR